jgi:NADPH-dependent curcumin reductase CurA
MVENKSLILAKNPIAFPIVGEDLVVTSSPFDLAQAAPESGLILKTNYISYDPYQRGRSKLFFHFPILPTTNCSQCGPTPRPT